MTNAWRLGVGTAAVVAWLIPGAAYADAILISQVRTTDAYAGPSKSSSTAPAGQNQWSGSEALTVTAGRATATATAVQVSTIGPLVFSGVGTGRVSLVAADEYGWDGYAVSIYEVNFELSSPYRYTWDAVVGVEHGGLGYGAGTAQAALFQPGGAGAIAGGNFSIQRSGRGSEAFVERTNRVGLLDPGQYFIYAFAAAFAPHSQERISSGRNEVTRSPPATSISVCR
jgi:hypothetical protein